MEVAKWYSNLLGDFRSKSKDDLGIFSFLSLSSTGLLNRIFFSFKPNLIGLQSFTYALC